MPDLKASADKIGSDAYSAIEEELIRIGISIGKDIRTVDDFYKLWTPTKLRVLAKVDFDALVLAIFKGVENLEPEDKVQVIKLLLENYNSQPSSYTTILVLQTYLNHSRHVSSNVRQLVSFLSADPLKNEEEARQRAVKVLSIIESIPNPKATRTQSQTRSQTYNQVSGFGDILNNDNVELVRALEEINTAKKTLKKKKVKRATRLVAALQGKTIISKEDEKEMQRLETDLNEKHVKSLESLHNLADDVLRAANELPPQAKADLSEEIKTLTEIKEQTNVTKPRLDPSLILEYSNKLVSIGLKINKDIEKLEITAQPEASNVKKPAFNKSFTSSVNYLLDGLSKLLSAIIEFKNSILRALGIKSEKKEAIVFSDRKTDKSAEELQEDIITIRKKVEGSRPV